MIPLTDVSRRYFPSCASSASSSAGGAGFSASRSPSRHRPRRLPPASRRTQTDRRAPLMRIRLVPFDVRQSRRTARSFACSGPSRFGVVPRPRHPRQEIGSPMRFFAPRVYRALPFSCALYRRRPRGSFVADLSGSRTGPCRLLSRPGRDRQSPGDVHGICLLPFAVLLSSAGDDACSDVSRPHAVSPLATARFIVAGSGWTEGLWPRLLGFGPTNEPYRVICRPRYSFYA